jgi:D-alanyl-D-alanine endopeptidase (penicillin-binding protein 7)
LQWIEISGIFPAIRTRIRVCFAKEWSLMIQRNVSKFFWLLALLPLVFPFSAQAEKHHHSKAAHHRVEFTPDNPALRSSTVLVLDQSDQHVVYSKNPDPVHPIASITKLMTAMVVMKSHQDLQETLTISDEDVDKVKFSHSHLRVGVSASRLDMMRMALIASENRAATTLGHNYPGGMGGFVQQMNTLAQQLGMTNTHFEDSSGLNVNNVSTAHDLALLVQAAFQVPLIREITTTSEASFGVGYRGREVAFHNTNPLVAKSNWDVGLSKTGFINESGQCLVMQVTISGRPLVVVLLDSRGKGARIADATRLRRWLEASDRLGTGHQI